MNILAAEAAEESMRNANEGKPALFNPMPALLTKDNYKKNKEKVNSRHDAKENKIKDDFRKARDRLIDKRRKLTDKWTEEYNKTWKHRQDETKRMFDRIKDLQKKRRFHIQQCGECEDPVIQK